MTTFPKFGSIVAGLVLIALGGCTDDTTGPGRFADARFAKGEKGGGIVGVYSDLVLLYRDVNGVPITDGPWEGEHGISHCVQPVTTEDVPNPYYLLDGTLPQVLGKMVNPVDGRMVTLVPLFAHFPEFLPPVEDIPDEGGGGGGSGGGGGGGGKGGKGGISGSSSEEEEDAVGEPCDVLVITVGGVLYSYAQFVKEAELERLNLIRSPEHVLMQHMKEVEALFLATDPSKVTLGSTGRPVFDAVEVDAMPKLQGIREALLETGTIPGADVLAFPKPFRLMNGNFSGWSTYHLSAFALAGAASKFGTINIDVVSYHDRLMGIPVDWRTGLGYWPKATIYSEELDEYFVDYRGFTYSRTQTFPGCFTYLDPANWSAGYQVRTLLETIPFGPLPPNTTPGGVLHNIAGYAQLAEDARAIILFIHDYEPVIAFQDPVGLESCAWQQELAASLNGGGGDPPPPPPDDPPTVVPPVAAFTYACQNSATCRFTDASTGTVESWAWVFAGSALAESTAQNPVVTFNVAGNHNVTLTVANSGGSHFVTQVITCTVSGKLRCY